MSRLSIRPLKKHLPRSGHACPDRERAAKGAFMFFTDKICVVTGGANGIGRCIVERFAASYARIAFVDVDGEAGRRLAGLLGPNVFFFEGDISQEQTQKDFAAFVLDSFGVVHFLINNACVSRKGILSGCGYGDFSHVLQLGLVAPYMLASLFMPAFGEQAAIVNIASTRAFMSQPDTESYSAAKGGVIALTHALAVSLAGKARVNAVSPGWIDTGSFRGEERYYPNHPAADRLQHPAGRLGLPEDIAAMVMFLCGPEAGFVTGQNMTVDGGMTARMIYHDEQGWSFKAGK